MQTIVGYTLLNVIISKVPAKGSLDHDGFPWDMTKQNAGRLGVKQIMFLLRISSVLIPICELYVLQGRSIVKDNALYK